MMRSAADFLPFFMTTFMNLASISLLYFGSGRMVRTGAWARRDIATYSLLLRALGAVLGATLLALAHTGTVERAAHRVIADTREVLDAAAADEHHRVLLQVVALAADVAGNLVAVGEAHAADLAQRRVGLLGRGGVHARADTALLRGCTQRRHFGFFGSRPAGFPDELTCGRHRFLISSRDKTTSEKHRAAFEAARYRKSLFPGRHVCGPPDKGRRF